MDSYYMDKFQAKYAERKKTDTSKTILLYFIYTETYTTEKNLKNRKQIAIKGENGFNNGRREHKKVMREFF